MATFPRPGVLALATLILTAPAAAAPPRADAAGDKLPDAALARFGTRRLRHPAPIRALDFSPDGTLIAAGGDDTILRVWDAATGKPARQFHGCPAAITAVAFSPDGQLVATACLDKSVRIWDLGARKEARTFLDLPGPALAVAWAPDGKTLAGAGQGGAISVWRAKEGDRQVELAGHDGATTGLAFSPDGKYLYSVGRDKAVRQWDVAAGEQSRQFPLARDAQWSLALAGDGVRLALGAGVTPPEADNPQAEPGTYERQPMVYLWNLFSDAPPAALLTSGVEVGAVAFSPDGKSLAAAGAALRVWDAATRVERLHLAGGPFAAVAWSRDGKWLGAAGADQAIRVYDAATGAERAAVAGHQGGLTAVAFTADGRGLAVAAAAEPRLRLWDVATAKPRGVGWHPTPADPPRGRLHSLTFAPDGQRLAFLSDGGIHLWDPADGAVTTVAAFALEAAQLTDQAFAVLAWTPDGQTLVAPAGPRTVGLWDVASGRRRVTFDVEGEVVIHGLAISPDGRWLAAATGTGQPAMPGMDAEPGEVHLWDLEAGQLRGKFNGHAGDVFAVAFSPDGRTAASAGADGVVRLWFVGNQRERLAVGEVHGPLYAVAFSPDGRTVAASGEGAAVRIWETATGAERRQFVGHQGRVPALAFAPDGKTLASGSTDTSAVAWDVYGLRTDRRPEAELTMQHRAEFWADLSGMDGVVAFDAITHFLGDAPEGPAYVARHLPPPPPPQPSARIQQWIRDLASPEFAARENAIAELGRMGEEAEVALRQALADKPPLEVERRMVPLVDKLGGAVSGPELMRTLRAIEILEQAGTPAAREALEKQAAGAPAARAAQEARAALARLRRR